MFFIEPSKVLSVLFLFFFLFIIIDEKFYKSLKKLVSISICFEIGSFGRRASDGGANLQIYYTTSASSGQSVEPIYANPANVKDLRIGVDSMQQQHSENMAVPVEGNDEPNDEIQR